MGAAASVLISSIITKALYKLRDPNGYNYNKDGAYAEMLGYVNECNELIYEILTDEFSELVGGGTGTITTVAGTQSYDLSSNSMGDFWLPKRLKNDTYAVWISEYEPMQMCTEMDTYEAINANEGSSTSRSMPERFCIIGDYLWFEEVPDDAYTVNLRYFPNFVAASAVTAAMPYKNLFNNEVIQGVVLLAKHRNELNVQVDAVLKDIFYDRAMRIMRKRRKTTARIVPRLR